MRSKSLQGSCAAPALPRLRSPVRSSDLLFFRSFSFDQDTDDGTPERPPLLVQRFRLRASASPPVFHGSSTDCHPNSENNFLSPSMRMRLCVASTFLAGRLRRLRGFVMGSQILPRVSARSRRPRASVELSIIFTANYSLGIDGTECFFSIRIDSPGWAASCSVRCRAPEVSYVAASTEKTKTPLATGFTWKPFCS